MNVYAYQQNHNQITDKFQQKTEEIKNQQLSYEQKDLNQKNSLCQFQSKSNKYHNIISWLLLKNVKNNPFQHQKQDENQFKTKIRSPLHIVLKIVHLYCSQSGGTQSMGNQCCQGNSPGEGALVYFFFLNCALKMQSYSFQSYCYIYRRFSSSIKKRDKNFIERHSKQSKAKHSSCRLTPAENKKEIKSALLKLQT
ncbi:hypothetical protein ABPG72_022132 [Tetrahymena utriculariae]